jgi:hypothetical protein
MQIYLHMQMHMNNEYEYTYADAYVYTVMAAHICIFHHMSMYLRIFGYINIHKHPEPETLLVKAP